LNPVVETDLGLGFLVTSGAYLWALMKEVLSRSVRFPGVLTACSHRLAEEQGGPCSWSQASLAQGPSVLLTGRHPSRGDAVTTQKTFFCRQQCAQLLLQRGGFVYGCWLWSN